MAGQKLDAVVGRHHDIVSANQQAFERYVGKLAKASSVLSQVRLRCEVKPLTKYSKYDKGE